MINFARKCKKVGSSFLVFFCREEEEEEEEEAQSVVGSFPDLPPKLLYALLFLCLWRCWSY